MAIRNNQIKSDGWIKASRAKQLCLVLSQMAIFYGGQITGCAENNREWASIKCPSKPEIHHHISLSTQKTNCQSIGFAKSYGLNRWGSTVENKMSKIKCGSNTS